MPGSGFKRSLRKNFGHNKEERDIAQCSTPSNTPLFISNRLHSITIVTAHLMHIHQVWRFSNKRPGLHNSSGQLFRIYQLDTVRVSHCSRVSRIIDLKRITKIPVHWNCGRTEMNTQMRHWDDAVKIQRMSAYTLAFLSALQTFECKSFTDSANTVIMLQPASASQHMMFKNNRIVAQQKTLRTKENDQTQFKKHY